MSQSKGRRKTHSYEEQAMLEMLISVNLGNKAEGDSNIYLPYMEPKVLRVFWLRMTVVGTAMCHSSDITGSDARTGCTQKPFIINDYIVNLCLQK